MKYKVIDQLIPKEKRTEINNKILYIIDNDLNCSISKDNIASCYTGNGGLHNLNYNNFNSYYEYSKEKKLVEMVNFLRHIVFLNLWLTVLNLINLIYVQI